MTDSFHLKWFALRWAAKEGRRINLETGETVSLIVRKRNGWFQEERTYGPDPARSPG